jgi:hypothetical protein
VTMLMNHAGDDVVEATWPRRDVNVKSCWRWHCRGNLAKVRCRCRVMLATILSSHAGNDAVEVTWSRHDVNIESC